MTFDDLTSGTPVFVDTNCLIYAATADPSYGPACKRLLERIESQDLPGFSSTHVLAELVHRLMTIEAAILFSRSLTGMAYWLRRHPDEVRQLTRHRLILDELLAMPLAILPVSGPLVSRAADVSIQFGMLTNDALVVAVMQESGLDSLASLDSDFDRVPGIHRYAPV